MTEPSESRLVFTIAKAMSQSTLPSTAALPPVSAAPLPPPRRRSFVTVVVAFGLTALIAAMGIFKSVKPPEPQPQIKASGDPAAESIQYEAGLNKLRTSLDHHSANQSVDPFKSYALDVAQLYLAIASFPKAKGK